MYIEKDGNEFVVMNESGYILATRKSESEARKFVKAQKSSRANKNSRRQERVTYSSRSDD